MHAQWFLISLTSIPSLMTSQLHAVQLYPLQNDTIECIGSPSLSLKADRAFIKATNWFWQVCLNNSAICVEYKFGYVSGDYHSALLVVFPLSFYQIKGLSQMYLFESAILGHTASFCALITHTCVQ